MSKWKHTVKIKHLIEGGISPEEIKKCVSATIELLEANPFFSEFHPRAHFLGIEDSGGFNEALDELYDYCDSKGIWLE